MDTQQITAPPCAQAAVSGVIHHNVRHTAGFTVIGNHLAQHRGLSLVAVGLAVHIQSLPAGAKVGIKRLAERFPESETRIAAALRELEAAGYLHRSRVRLADGRIVTRTVSCNQPGADAATATPPPPRPARHGQAPIARTASSVTGMRIAIASSATDARVRPAARRSPRTGADSPYGTTSRPCRSPTRSPPSSSAPPPRSSPTCAATHLNSACPRLTSAPSFPGSPPGSNATRIRTPSDALSPPTCPYR